MLAAVGLSLAGRDSARRLRGALDPLRARGDARARRDADHPGVRLPDAGRDPLLGRTGRGCDHDDDLRDPARDPDHGPRDPRRPGQHGRGRARDGLDLGADAREGAPPAGAADAASLGQPDHPVRAVHGRDRRPHRRQGPRRRGDERPQLVSRLGASRGPGHRRHGDGARPGDGVGCRADEPCPAPSHGRAPPASCAWHRSPRASPIVAVVVVSRGCSVSAPTTRARPRATGCSRGSSPMLDYVQNPDTSLFRITSWIGDHIVQYGLVPFRNFLVETPVARDAARDHAHLARRERAALGDHDVPDARRDRRDRRVELGDGHGLAGARRDRAHGRDRPRPRHLGGGEPDVLADPAARQRRAADAAAARVPDPADLPDARVRRPGGDRRASCTHSPSSPASSRTASATSRRTRSRPPRRSVRRGARSCARSRSRSPRTRSCSASTRGSSWCSPSS